MTHVVSVLHGSFSGLALIRCKAIICWLLLMTHIWLKLYACWSRAPSHETDLCWHICPGVNCRGIYWCKYASFGSFSGLALIRCKAIICWLSLMTHIWLKWNETSLVLFESNQAATSRAGQNTQPMTPGIRRQLRAKAAHNSQKYLLTHLPWTKWPLFRRRYFQTDFRAWKCQNLDSIFTEMCSEGSHQQ